jgi:hypothetical protein
MPARPTVASAEREHQRFREISLASGTAFPDSNIAGGKKGFGGWSPEVIDIKANINLNFVN